MGNSSSSGRGHHDETVDFGSLVPQGVYTGPRDWNQAIVSQLIVARRLAPFYRPLEDYEDSWDDEQILAARKELPDPDASDVVTRIEATATASKSKRPGSLKEPAKPEAQVYRGAVECPICFLYYPTNINHSRCCDQAICTECFVQIKRAEPTTTHLSSEPAACPYCVQENFGVVYTPPPWRAGLGSEGFNGLFSDTQKSSETTVPRHKRRQKSFSADSPEVVTTDQIRPDWEAKLEAVRATVARRANRRILMRQVGDRLIPVGVTSGRVHALTPEEAAAAGAEAGSRRSRRRQGQGDGPFGQIMGMSGQDLEELMLMEAMRLSLLEHEEQQRKEADAKKKAEDEAVATAGAGAMLLTEQSQASALEPSTLQTSSNQRSVSPSSSLPTRTPPPPPSIPLANLSLGEENQATWRDSATNPPAFSTLTAALTSASTAAAVLGTSPSDEERLSRSASSQTTPPSEEPEISSSSAPFLVSTPPITSVTARESNDTRSGSTFPGASQTSGDDTATLPSSSPFSDASTPSISGQSPDSIGVDTTRINGLRRATSATSSTATLEGTESDAGIGVASDSYDVLASSPGSGVSYEPLLQSTNSAANGDISMAKRRTIAPDCSDEVSR